MNLIELFERWTGQPARRIVFPQLSGSVGKGICCGLSVCRIWIWMLLRWGDDVSNGCHVSRLKLVCELPSSISKPACGSVDPSPGAYPLSNKTTDIDARIC